MVFVSELTPGTVDAHKSFYGKALVATADDGTQTLFSYRTRVAKVGPDGVRVTRNPYHLTQTTLRHIREFIAQTTGEVDFTKAQILNGHFDPLTA